MTRDEAIQTLTGNKSNTPWSYSFNETECEKLAALLREPYLPDDYRQTLVALFASYKNLVNRDNALVQRTQQILERLAPVPKVEWVDVGCNSVAAVGEWSLVVSRYPISDSQWEFRVNKYEKAMPSPSSGTLRFSRNHAKVDAEDYLKKLMRGTP